MCLICYWTAGYQVVIMRCGDAAEVRESGLSFVYWASPLLTISQFWFRLAVITYTIPLHTSTIFMTRPSAVFSHTNSSQNGRFPGSVQTPAPSSAPNSPFLNPSPRHTLFFPESHGFLLKACSRIGTARANARPFYLILHPTLKSILPLLPEEVLDGVL
jgi:hypothetical protein